MQMTKSFKEIVAWQKAHAFVLQVYKTIRTFPSYERLNISQGSLEECRYYILLSKDLEYITIEQYNMLNQSIEETSRLLTSYSKGIKERNVL